MQKFRSFIFFIGWNLNGLLILPIFILMSAIGGIKFRRKLMPYWCQFSLWWLKVSCNVHYKVEGLENLSTLKTQPSLVLSKHQSTFETFFLAAVLPPHVFVLKRELLWIPIFGWILWLMQAIAINRSEGSKSFKKLIRDAKTKLSEGVSVVMFPEGTRVKLGDDSQYKMGAFRLATLLKVPILPISHNAGQAWAKGQFVKKAGTIRVVIGKPIETDGVNAEALMEMTKNWMEIYANQPLEAA